ncbi:MAG: restriction endonuclease subunit S [Planctomycetota bacterium]|jgi:type I restriction enzyme S subunit
MVWSELTLGELIELKRGYDLPTPIRKAGDVPVVSSRGISGRHDVARAKAPGVVVGRTGTLGEVVYLERDFWPLNTTLYVRDFKGNDPRFVSYLLETLDYHALSDKAAVPGVSRAQLHSLPVQRPPLREQRNIANQLQRFDDKIAILQRMDRLLAWAAAAHYARLPKGRSVRVETLCRAIANGGTPSRGASALWNGGMPWFRSGELRDGPLIRSIETITERALAESACRRFPRGTVLVALYASPTVGRLGVLEIEAAANQACCALLPKSETVQWILFHSLRAHRRRLQRLAVGAVQQNISQRVIRELEIPLPSRSALRSVREKVAPLHRLRGAQAREIHALKAWRDATLEFLLAPPSLRHGFRS